MPSGELKHGIKTCTMTLGYTPFPKKIKYMKKLFKSVFALMFQGLFLFYEKEIFQSFEVSIM